MNLWFISQVIDFLLRTADQTFQRSNHCGSKSVVFWLVVGLFAQADGRTTVLTNFSDSLPRVFLLKVFISQKFLAKRLDDVLGVDWINLGVGIIDDERC